VPRTIALIIGAAVLFTLARPASAFTADSCGGGCPKPPSNTRAVSAEDVILVAYPGNTLTATLAKGKKKTVLMADGMLSDGRGGSAFLVSREFDLGISVNGLSMNPSHDFGPGSPNATEDCGEARSDPDRTCTVIGHWWLDMDDPANAALIGVPITVTLVGDEALGGPAAGNELVDMSLRVRVEKK
jgi:hypothetical protein